MRARSNIIASYIFIVLNILINLFVVRLTVQYYGDAVYAFVVLAYSFVTYVETFNMGTFISNRTQIPLRGENASIYTLATIKKLTIFVTIIFLVWLTFYNLFAEEFISLISSEKDESIISSGKTLINVAVIYGLIKVPLSVVLSSFAGHNHVDIEKRYNGLQQIVKLLALYSAITFNLSVEFYFITFSVLGIFVLIVANIHYFKKYISHKLHPYIKYSKKISSLYIVKKSFKFYLMTLTSVVVWSTDNLIISIFFTPKFVSDYSINFAIFNAAFLFITAIAGALIANYGNLIRDKHFDILNFRLNLSIYTTFVLGLLICFGGVLFGQDIITLWVGDGHHISNNLLIIFGIFGITISITSVTNTILSLCASTKILVLMALGEALLNIILSLIILKLVGVEGVAIATVVAAIAAMVIPGLLLLKNLFKSHIKIELVHLVSNFVVLCLFLCFTQGTNLSFVFKVLIFIIYFIIILIYTFFFNKEYFLSYLKMISNSYTNNT